jgi:DNA invertase Pin-like site-specific DNA recombinase
MERRMVGYVRVGPREPRAGRPEPADQRRAIEAACRERGWRLTGVEEDVRSGRTLRRDGLRRAIAACRAGATDGIVVARLDRLTYSLADLAELVREAVRGGYGIVSLDPAVDLENTAGRAVADVLAAAADWTPRGLPGRARLLARRSREDDAPEAPRGPGRPSSTPPDLARRIRAMRARGLTLQAICDTLNDEGVPTPRGGALWRPTSLRAVLRPGGGDGPD